MAQAAVAVGRDTDGAGRAHDAVGMQRRARERVRAAARPAGEPEAVEAELVGDRDEVRDRVHDSAAVEPRRAAVAGAVVRDEADAELLVELLVRPALQPAARRPVHAHDRKAVRVAPDGERDRAAVSRLQGA